MYIKTLELKIINLDCDFAILKIKKKLNAILSENTGKSEEEIERDCERGHFMAAEEAKNYGLIDKVIYKR